MKILDINRNPINRKSTGTVCGMGLPDQRVDMIGTRSTQSVVGAMTSGKIGKRMETNI